MSTGHRWALDADGGIGWKVAPSPAGHKDHAEMSGRRVSVIVHYGVNGDGTLALRRQVVWPMLRTVPNDTHASLIHWFDGFPAIKVDGRPIGPQRPVRFGHRGMLIIECEIGGGLRLVRWIHPSVDKPCIVEQCELLNDTGRTVEVEVEPRCKVVRTDPANGVYGPYVLEMCIVGASRARLKPGERCRFAVVFSGRRADEPPLAIEPAGEAAARREYVERLWTDLRFECPDPVLERAFAFAKLRTTESVYETRGGLMHGPGGAAYYAAVWANDQAEYANPFFPFVGDAAANESAINSYRHFARFMNEEYRPIPSSIIAEGVDIWHGAKDRGDAAMIAYGAARFAMALGDAGVARRLWPLIAWCLEYCRRKTNARGVIESDSDELEGRLPAGKANLATSALAHDALISAAYLADELDEPAQVSREYRRRADALRAAIEAHFGADVEGLRTYRYYEGNTVLRAWICVPLCMGILDRAAGTVDAMFSPRLWTADGLATQAGDGAFWDRETLYGLRGAFAAGETRRAMDFFRRYSARRLLGEHVPYPVEAYPEGNQRHLAAESALYCRVVTEGLFGIRPTGLRSFECRPRLPEDWDGMALRRVKAFGQEFDLTVSRMGKGVEVTVTPRNGVAIRIAAPAGEVVAVRLRDA